MWRDGAPDGGPPNDWESVFEAAGPAWTLRRARPASGTCTRSCAEQPDLNWDNPEVEAAMHDVLRFWLDRGVDGLPARRDLADRQGPAAARPRPARRAAHDEDWDTIHERLRGIRRVVDEYDDRMIVGEVALHDLHRIVSYLRSGDQLHLAHNFLFAEQAVGRRGLPHVDRRLRGARRPARRGPRGSSPTTTSRASRRASTPTGAARAIGVLLYALRGTPFIYQGEELGLPDAEIPPDRVVDVDGRDPERAPIPWEPPSVAGPGAGFTHRRAVAAADRRGGGAVRRAPGRATRTRRCRSYRRLAELRAGSEALQTGSQRTLDLGPGLLAWVREAGDERILAIVNFAGVESGPVSLESGAALLLSSRPGRDGDVRRLGPFEAVLLRLES